MQAILALEDGTIFTGEAFGATGSNWGEVIFNTGMTGYQEILTDPAYCGQIVVMTYPLIGNCGIMKEVFDSNKSYPRGLIVREYCEQPSNWRLTETLSRFLQKENVLGLAGIDTRALTRHLRKNGTLRGVISTDTSDVKTLIQQAAACPYPSWQELADGITVKEICTLAGGGHRVVLIDFGSNKSIVNCLQQRGCEVVLVPPDTAAGQILALRPEGIVLSNGPGDPANVPGAVETIGALIGKTPILGICLGHQLLGLALGAKTYKMKFGHRGTNHPVKDLANGRVYISAHNHGYSIDEESIAGLDITVSHRNLNDGTVEGLKHNSLPVFSVQYHPESSPGPRDSEYIFDQFIDIMNKEAR